jgi:hypothetical protein
MSFSNAAENAIIALLFNATTWANVAINATSSPITNIYLSGHTADPGEAGDQTTSEIAYTSYARKDVARTSGGFTVSGNAATLAALTSFAAGTGGSGTMTHVGCGRDVSGAGQLFMKGTVSPNIVCGNGITPQLTTASSWSLD